MSGFLKPHPPSTVSHWIASNRGRDSLDNHGADDALPETADIVVVGAGIAGAFAAYYLTRPGAAGDGKRVVILEGGEVASSATGRNGGHLAPATYGNYQMMLKPRPFGPGLSAAESLAVLRMEWENYQANVALVREHALADAVDLWSGRISTVFTGADELEQGRQLWQEWEAALAEHGDKDWTETQWTLGPDAEKESRVKGAVGVSTRLGGSIHPHKFAAALLKLALASTTSTVTLHTSTPVLSLSNGPNETVLRTPRGEVRATTVVLATNAHTRHLLPEHAIARAVYPVRAQMALVTPPPSYAGSKAAKTSYGIGSPYAIVAGSAGMVFGQGALGWTAVGVREDEIVDNVEDWKLFDNNVGTNFYKQYAKDTFVGWGDEAHGEGLTRTWTGVMGYTVDRMPLVGALPDAPGVFVAVGFNGHGMSTSHIAARALAHQIHTGEWDARLPRRAFEVTPERLALRPPRGGLVSILKGTEPEETNGSQAFVTGTG
ncbi:hypothetical protein Q5752_002740 [Cryptotrichosporon argae]